ncbi:MAG: DUF309 domain-containing protein [Halobacteriovoraceae bacterium]|nr:DUF309 domain-containing protein [Halobacteriovoraceae bacterium]
MKSSRYTKNPFPPYAYLPGKAVHPLKKGGHMEKTGDPVVPPMDFNNPGESTAYLYAIDLFNHDFFWESHVWWEALWHRTGRKGIHSDFLKALIKFAAAGVKFRLGQKKAAHGHCLRAVELLQTIEKTYPSLAGFELKELIVMGKSRNLISLQPKI